MAKNKTKAFAVITANSTVKDKYNIGFPSGD